MTLKRPTCEIVSGLWTNRFPGLFVILVVALFALSCKRASTSSPAHRNRVEEARAKVEEEPVEVDLAPEVPAIHVHAGEDIQAALDKAAFDDVISTVIVHPGTSRPTGSRQALIWFNAKHDGIHLLADGDVTLTAANPNVADRLSSSFPALVNHVIYCGDGVGPSTKIEGFKITGANNAITTKGPVIEPVDDPELKRTAYFYLDGGGIKIFGRSYPTLERLEIFDNYSSPCGAGISVEHRGFTQNRVTIRNCVFRNNRVPLTGAALDLLGQDKGSAALVENCLFIGNASNCTMDDRSLRLGTWMPKAGHGAITLFKHSRADFRDCTIVGNRNGVDDLSSSTNYQNCIFWDNTAEGGWPTDQRYETAITNAPGVKQCFIGGGGEVAHRATLDPNENVLDAPDPEFDEAYLPRNPLYENAGYRGVGRTDSTQPSNVDQASVPLDDEPLIVQARGSDFNWYFSYSGADGQPNTNDDIRTRRHLYLPTGRPVRIQLESDDYLYSLKLPAQGAHEIAVPGMIHFCTVTETKSGNYPLRGDQFCGYSHPNLVGRVIVQPPARFAKLLSANQIRANQ